MKKFKILSLALLLSLAFVSGASANKFSVDGFTINTSGLISEFKTYTESDTTNDTVTAAKTGATFLVDASAGGTLTYTLPTAAAGLTYKFVSIGGHQTSGQGTIILSPQSTDTFVGCVTSSVTSTFTAGDDLDSPQATGDTVTIVGASTKWYCVDRIGTWVDGN